MLTKNLLRYRTENGRIHPQFIAPTDSALLAIAAELIALFEAAPTHSRATLLERSKSVIESPPGTPIVKRGLEKLLLDRTTFDTAPNDALISFRQTLFTETSRLLSEKEFATYEEYRRNVLRNALAMTEDSPTLETETETELAAKLYGDLPSGQPVLEFRTLSAERLLHRYNAAQVQGLLIHSDTVTLKLAESMTAELRQLFKYLRFNQLLSTIQKTEGGYCIVVDGPLNLFYKTKRYGLNLANFFGAVLHQPKWELTAAVRFRNRRAYTLALDDSCGIKPVSQQFHAYIPDDIQLFQTMLRNRTEAWQAEPANRFLALPGDRYCFPDYELTHTTGVAVAIELFHPWHQGPLIARLNTLAEQKGVPLLLGVSKPLEKKPHIAEALSASPYFSAYGFTFRDVPTVRALLPILNSLL